VVAAASVDEDAAAADGEGEGVEAEWHGLALADEPLGHPRVPLEIA
jgi:hypothetical protein